MKFLKKRGVCKFSCMIFIMFMCIYPMESHALARLQSEIKGQDGWSYWKIESKKVVNSTYYGSYRTVGSATVKKKMHHRYVNVYRYKDYRLRKK